MLIPWQRPPAADLIWINLKRVSYLIWINLNPRFSIQNRAGTEWIINPWEKPNET